MKEKVKVGDKLLNEVLSLFYFRNLFYLGDENSFYL